jgi:Sec-independent protein translocase protein TatA
MSLGIGEIFLIVLILSLIFGVSWIGGLAGWVRKLVRGFRDGLEGEDPSKREASNPADKKL